MPRKEILKMFNGNKEQYKKGLPAIIILDKMNDVARAWIEKQTGLKLEVCYCGLKMKPKRSQQITKLFLTYNFKARYFDNSAMKNTMLLKFSNEEI
jgi:hypothetical protein